MGWFNHQPVFVLLWRWFFVMDVSDLSLWPEPLTWSMMSTKLPAGGNEFPNRHFKGIRTPKWPKIFRLRIWVFPKIGVFPPKWMVKIMDNPIKMDNLGVPLFSETPIYNTLPRWCVCLVHLEEGSGKTAIWWWDCSPYLFMFDWNFLPVAKSWTKSKIEVDKSCFWLIDIIN